MAELQRPGSQRLLRHWSQGRGGGGTADKATGTKAYLYLWSASQTFIPSDEGQVQEPRKFEEEKFRT